MLIQMYIIHSFFIVHFYTFYLAWIQKHSYRNWLRSLSVLFIEIKFDQRTTRIWLPFLLSFLGFYFLFISSFVFESQLLIRRFVFFDHVSPSLTNLPHNLCNWQWRVFSLNYFSYLQLLNLVPLDYRIYKQKVVS